MYCQISLRNTLAMPLKDEKAIPPEPWHSFLRELDALAIGIVDFQCLGGFVVTQLYGLNRSTGDLDVLSIAPVEQRKDFLEKAGRGSALHKRYKIYLDYVGVASIPYEYESRLIEMYPGTYRHIRLFALDPYDIALSKLCRNIARDRPSRKTRPVRPAAFARALQRRTSA
jgi:hypothetical protein